MGCVLTLYGAIQQKLTQAHGELRSAQEELHTLLDRDQLTGIFNRRALPTMLHEAQANGAAILFLDLDDFKKVNDLHGHHAGDACLVRFARTLSESLPAADRVIRACRRSPSSRFDRHHFRLSWLQCLRLAQRCPRITPSIHAA